MKPGPVMLSWEYMDGSSGQELCNGEEEARANGYALPGSPRVWIDDEVMLQGFTAPDDQGWMF